MTSHNPIRWEYSNWANGPPFLNGWCDSQLGHAADGTTITLSNTACQTYNYASGEYRTLDLYASGYCFEAVVQSSAVPGTITGLFTYIDQPHDEIDIELKGNDPTRMQVNYWTAGVEHPSLLDLGFDASQGEHRYSFIWQNTGIQWYVDGKLVHSEDGSKGPLPTTAGRLTLNYWACDNLDSWCGTYSDGGGSHVRFSDVNIVPL